MHKHIQQHKQSHTLNNEHTHTHTYENTLHESCMMPIQLVVEKRPQIHRLRCGNGKTHFRVATGKARTATTEWWQRKWDTSTKGGCTLCVIPAPSCGQHGELVHYLTKLLIGHGCFRANLPRFQSEGEASCSTCTLVHEEVEHILVFFHCPGFAYERETMWSSRYGNSNEWNWQ